MNWFLVYMCDEDMINTSMTYQDVIFAKGENEAKELACAKWSFGFVCIGVRVATAEEVALLGN